MIVVLALLLAVTCYAAAAALAVMPLARPVGPPVQGVVTVLSLGVIAHFAALIITGFAAREVPIVGLGPALSFVGLTLAVVLLLTESLVRDVTLSLIGAPLAAGVTAAAVFLGWRPAGQPGGAQGAWLASHIAVSFIGIAALATAAAAGALYLVERRGAQVAPIRISVSVLSATRDPRSRQPSQRADGLGCPHARDGARGQLHHRLWAIRRRPDRLGRCCVAGGRRPRRGPSGRRMAGASRIHRRDRRVWARRGVVPCRAAGCGAAWAFPVMSGPLVARAWAGALVAAQ